MAGKDDAETLARVWIESWRDGTPERIPLAQDFTHTSPLGRMKGREAYLDWVKPLAAQNVRQLEIRRILASGREAAVHFEMQTPQGAVEVCDWIVVRDGEITEIHSFFDATVLREGAEPAS